MQENLDLYADLQGVPKDARAERYAELMQMTGLAAVHPPAGRAALRRHEAEARPGLHAGAAAAPAVAG